MEKKKQGFFSALKDEVVRGLSPSRSRPASPSRRSSSPMSRLLRRRHPSTDCKCKTDDDREQPQHEQARHPCAFPDPSAAPSRSGGLKPFGEALAPLMEGPPDHEGGAAEGRKEGWRRWVRGQLHIRGIPLSPGSSGCGAVSAASTSASASYQRSDLRLLLGVMGAPLAPVHVSSADPSRHLSIKDTPIEASSAQYILQQYTAASGGQKLQSSIRNSYAMGKVKLVASEFENANKVMKNCHSSKAAESGSFVLWQMRPDMWYVELSVGGSKIHAGCNGKLVWRHTPWVGAHAAKGPVRPLRRGLQGLDPRNTAKIFSNARCIGEKKINGEECFILKLSADPQTLKSRSEGPAEIIRHVLFGYFSQRTGLLVQIEDSHLTRIQSNNCSDSVYWETTINSFLTDYRPVEGMMIAHSGRSIVTLLRFGEMAMSHSKTRMEEEWTIEEVAFNVPGLSMDCFIPPADIKSKSVNDPHELPRGERGKAMAMMAGAHRLMKVAAISKQHDNLDNVVWRVEI